MAGQQEAHPPPVAGGGAWSLLPEEEASPCGASASPWGAMCPIRPNVLWAMDVCFEQTSDARTRKLSNVIDECTRECLAIGVGGRIGADAVVTCLERLAHERGSPARVRFDHGPEFHRLRGGRLVSFQWHRDHVHRRWCPPGGARGSNPSTADRETSCSTASCSVVSSRPLLEAWRTDYISGGPHSALNWRSPAEFAEDWIKRYLLPLAQTGAHQSGTGQGRKAPALSPLL